MMTEPARLQSDGGLPTPARQCATPAMGSTGGQTHRQDRIDRGMRSNPHNETHVGNPLGTVGTAEDECYSRVARISPEGPPDADLVVLGSLWIPRVIPTATANATNGKEVLTVHPGETEQIPHLLSIHFTLHELPFQFAHHHCRG